MASNQKKRCARPSFAAAPTQVEPTTKRIWVRTRSKSPSGFLSDSLRVSTFCSARSKSVVTAIDSVDVDLSVALRLFLSVAGRFEIRGGEFFLRHTQCNRRARE